MILDTSFLVDVLRGVEAATEWERRLDESGTAAVTPITVMELWEGTHRAEASDEERAQVERLLEGLPETPFDTAAAIRAGDVNATLKERGERIEVQDVMIGAIALERDEPVLTRNGDHFSRIDDLAVETY